MSHAAAAQAVVDYLNKGGYTHTFRAERRALPRKKITEADTLVVSVFKGARTSTPVRGPVWVTTYTIYVVFQQKLPTEAREAVEESDKLTAVAEQFEAYLQADDDLGDFRFSGYDETSERLPFDADALEDAGIYSTVIGLEVVKVV